MVKDVLIEKEAEYDAAKNSRKRSKYTITKVRNIGNRLVKYIFDLNEKCIRGQQYGKTIKWN